MLISMTGFASDIIEIPLSTNHDTMILAISIKSLNSRFFEMNCKMPSLLHNLEVAVQKILQKQLHRGSIFLTIKIINTERTQEVIKPALENIQKYMTAISTIQQHFKFQDQITLAQILQLPNVLQAEEMQVSEDTQAAILHAIQTVAEKVIETQKKEGAQLAHDIAEQIARMQAMITTIQNLSVAIIQDKKNTLTSIMHDLAAFDQSADLKTTEQCLLEAKKTTLMYEIEKIDINEETVRFNAHLHNITLQLASADPVKGKKLDFIIQELNREINTIAAKCLNIEISSLAIDIKAVLEKAREQAQNII